MSLHDDNFETRGPSRRTGNEVVDEMTTFKFEGIIIDHRWIGHPLLSREGKRGWNFDRDAAYVLAYICYFYQARVERDAEGHEVSVTKRFDGDAMYQDYEIMSQAVGCSKRELQDIIAFLKSRNLITTWAEPVILRNGLKTNNMPHIVPNPGMIYELTYGDLSVPKFGGGVPKKREASPENEKTHIASRKNEVGIPKKREASSEKTGDIYIKNPKPFSKRTSTTSTRNFLKKTDAVAAEISNEIQSPTNAAFAAPSESHSPTDCVKSMLLEFAAARGISLSDADATALVATWPAASLADGQLLGALTDNFEKYGLDKPVDNPARHPKLRGLDPARLRWFLCVWRAFDESRDEFHEKTGHKWNKTQCFLNKVADSQPPATWLEGALRQLRTEQAKAIEERETGEARAYFEALPAALKKRLTDDALADLQERKPAEFFNARSPEVLAHRLKMLRDPETRAWLEELKATSRNEAKRTLAQAFAQAEAKAHVNGAAPKNEADEAGFDESPPQEVEQTRFTAFVSAILRDINAGVLALADVDDARPQILEDAEWREVKNQVVIELRKAA